MTQQDDTEKKEQTTKKQSTSQSQKNPGTNTMEPTAKKDTKENIANPNAAQGSASDGDSAS